jgi:arylsulfatase A-like enzyme
LKRFSAVLVVVWLLAACTPDGSKTSPAPVETRQAERPNILVVVTDDMRVDGLLVMDFTNEWFSSGTKYLEAYATTPLCCPARASIFTGRYAHNHGVLKNQDSHDLDTDTTIQAHLQTSGYTTAMVGKYLNSWSVEDDPPHFDEWALYAGRYYGKPFNVNGKIVETTDYSTYHVAKRAQQFLHGFEDNDEKPWYLYVATEAPHAPFTVAPQYKAAPIPTAKDAPSLYKNLGLTERDLSDKPDLPRRPFSLEKPNILRKKQLRTLMSVDDVVRKLAKSLENLGEERDTLVFFLSDQGLLQGEHGLYAKRLPYTESIKIPLLMRWPGHDLPRLDRDLVANVDLAPTIRDVAGIPPGTMPVDGISLLGGARRTQLLLEQQENWRVGLPNWRSIRTLDYQYVEYYKRDGSLFDREYYKVQEDPFQLLNLLGDDDPSNDPDVERLSETIARYQDCREEGCVISE